MNISKERRRYRRIETNIKISFKPKGEKTSVPSMMINMSPGGMLLKSEKAFPLELIVTTKIEKSRYSKKEIQISGFIKRCDTIYENKLYHLALEIDRSQKGSNKALEDFYMGLLEFKKKDSEQRLKN